MHLKQNSYKISNELKEAIKKEGFSLEHEVFQILEKDKWFVYPNRYFFDHATGKISEYDILAVKEKKIGKFIFKLVLIIECKYLCGNSVFYVRRLKNKDYPILRKFINNIDNSSDEVVNVFSTENISKVVSGLKQYKNMFFSEEQVFGYQTFKSANKSKSAKSSAVEKNIKKTNKKPLTSFVYNHDKDTYENLSRGLKGVAMAAYYETEKSFKEEKSSVGKSDFVITFPLLIIEGIIFKHTLAKSSRTSLKNNIFRYRTAVPQFEYKEPKEFYTYIIKKEYLVHALRFFNQLFNKLSKSFCKSAKIKN